MIRVLGEKNVAAVLFNGLEKKTLKAEVPVRKPTQYLYRKKGRPEFG